MLLILANTKFMILWVFYKERKASLVQREVAKIFDF